MFNGRLSFNPAYMSALGIFCAAGLFLNIFFIQSAYLGVAALILYFFFVGSRLGSRISPNEPRDAQLFFGALTLILFFLLANTAIYYFFRMDPVISGILILMPLFTFLQRDRLNNKKANFLPGIHDLKLKTLSLSFLFFIGEAALFYRLFQAQTLEAMPSPWQALGPEFFLLYALVTACLFFSARAAKSIYLRIILAIAHFFLTYAIAAIVYPLGFGFDGIIHRATEEWISLHGSIAPKNPFYIGQYSLIVWLHHITRLPVALLDTYFVPVITSLTIPPMVMYALKRAWGITSRTSIYLMWIIPMLFFLPFHLTTPHNTVLLFAVLTVFAMIGFLNGALTIIIPFLLAAASLATHPLIGAPLFMFVLTGWMFEKLHTDLRRKIFLTLSGITIAILPILLFSAYYIISGQPMPDFSNPLARLDYFLLLLRKPYWITERAPLIFELAYFWQRITATLVIILGTIGWIGLRKQKKLWIFPTAVFGLWIGAFLLRSWVVFPNVPIAEQGDYPLRLLRTSVILFVPFAMYVVAKLAKEIIVFIGFIRHIRPIATPLTICAIAALTTISLYDQYPQRNPKVHFPGYNMSIHDIRAVRKIHSENTEYNYIVLGNPLVSAAALREYSFAKYFSTPRGDLFYHAIPTGGPLFTAYLQMVYEGQTRETMDSIMDLVGVKKAYFVMDDYWKDYEFIVAGAKKTADLAESIDGGKIWIFTYLRD